MGCVTSKVMSKSISFKEELNKSLQRRSNSISSIQELIVSGNTSDQFLGLLCKLPSETESNTNPKPDISTEDTEAWELPTDVGQERQSYVTSKSSSTSPTAIMDVDDLARRSKSCHWFPEYAMDSSSEIKEDESNASTKRARSIHTVEEYDAILAKLWLSKSHQTGSDDQSTDEASQKEKISSSGLGTTEASSSTEDVLNANNGEAREHNISEKGLKRKAVAKGLESLSVPQTIEFQNAASHKDWLQAESPGAYVTPKFGSYALPSSSSTDDYENQCSASVAFNPELVAAFEECMLQLQEEEEMVLKQIAEDLEEEDKQTEGEEGIPSLSKDIQVQI